MDITVSIVNHNSLETLAQCLEAVEDNLGGIDAEVYVVDNLCDNMAATMIASQFPRVHVLKNTERLGFSANHNQVIRKASGRYVLVLNPDVMLSSDSIGTMFQVMNANHTVAVCGPQLVDVTGKPSLPSKHLLKPLKDTVLLACYISNCSPSTVARLTKLARSNATTDTIGPRGSDLADLTPTSIYESRSVSMVSGACMFFRRSALDDVGFFDDRFFLYFEETDWCLRARARGWEIRFLPNVTAVHIGGTSTRSNYLWSLNVYVRSALTFYRKHRGRQTERIMEAVLRAIATCNWLRWSLARIAKRPSGSQHVPWIEFSRNLALHGPIIQE